MKKSGHVLYDGDWLLQEVLEENHHLAAVPVQVGSGVLKLSPPPENFELYLCDAIPVLLVLAVPEAPQWDVLAKIHLGCLQRVSDHIDKGKLAVNSQASVGKVEPAAVSTTSYVR